jgi:hypothetical protein
MTTEQLIILAFLAGAFAAGWATHALTDLWDRRGRGGTSFATPSRLDLGRPDLVDETRRELGHAIRAYHAAVTISVAEREGWDGATGEATLDVLARALVALAAAVDHAWIELEAEHPLAQALRQSGLELRRLAADVIEHTREERLPNGVSDRLEQQLMSAASAILARPRARTQPA